MRKRRTTARTVTACAGALLLAAGLSHAAQTAEQAPQQVAVIDGNTLQIDGKVLNLAGIDAPEIGQLCFKGGAFWPCGMRAALALQKLIGLSLENLQCEVAAESPVPLASCEVDRQDVAEVLLRQGHVVALADSSIDYRNAQKEAKSATLGIWNGRFTDPRHWRAGGRLTVDGKDDEDCNVKAVVSGGEKLYYVPLDPGYKSISVEPANGDQMLCSAAEARHLGWHRKGEIAAAGMGG